MEADLGTYVRTYASSAEPANEVCDRAEPLEQDLKITRVVDTWVDNRLSTKMSIYKKCKPYYKPKSETLL